MYAKGLWTYDNGVVRLEATHKGDEPRFEPFPSKKYAQLGGWRWFAAKNCAVYVEHEPQSLAKFAVTFKPKSGNVATAVTDLYGYAPDPSSPPQPCATVGLRRRFSSTPIQWFAVPPEGVRAGIAAFTITYPSNTEFSLFQGGNLKVVGNKLQAEIDEDSILKGTYAKKID